MSDEATDKERIDPRLYTLSEQQFAYLLNGETGDRTASDLETEIQQTAENLSDRLRYLAEDLAILDQHGLLESADEPDTWDELTNLSRRDGRYHTPKALMKGKMRDIPNQFEYIQPAVHLGQVTRLLYRNTAPTFDEALTGMGLLLGLDGRFLKEQEAAEYGAFFKDGDDALQTIEELLDTFEGYFQSDPTTGVQTEGLREELESIDLAITDPLLKEADKRAVNRDLPPVQSYLESLADQLESNPDLQAIETLADQIQEDIQTLTELRYIDAYGIDIIHGVYQEEKFGAKDAIAEHADTSKHQVAKLLNDLQGREPPWDHRPLVHEEPERGYSPTSYGYLVGAIVSEHSRTGGEQRVVESDAGRHEIIRLLHRYHFTEDLDGHEHLQTVLRNQFHEGKQEDPG